jgi:uncharacterized protein GlcG (DUF336 family)
MRHFLSALAVTLLCAAPVMASAKSCDDLPNYEALQTALKEARAAKNGGLNLDMWATLVDRNGIVCAVAYTGETVDAQWPGSRVISAQKANTANAFSLKGLALSTANLYSATQPGGSLFGLQESNPVDTKAAYEGPATSFGGKRDPMVGKAIGGVNVFGGGLALYDEKGEILGGIGVSGDTSCADHNIAWRARHALKLDYVPNGVAPGKTDQIIYDIMRKGQSTSGFGHALCGGQEPNLVKTLPAVQKVAKAEKPAEKAAEKATEKADVKKQ